MWRGWSVLAITAVAVIALQKAQAGNTSNNSAETEAVTVTGEATGSLPSVSPEESAKQKMAVSGSLHSEPNPEIFHPSDGRSFYGGVSWNW